MCFFGSAANYSYVIWSMMLFFVTQLLSDSVKIGRRSFMAVPL